MLNYLDSLLSRQDPQGGAGNGVEAAVEQAAGQEGGLAEAAAAAESSSSAVDVGGGPPPAPPYEWGSYFFPRQASEVASQVDFLFYAIFWISTFFFVLIIGLMVYFVIKYRRRPGHEKALPSSSHNTPLEILWSVVPSIILVWIFVTGARGFFEMRIIPEAAEEIWVKAQQFNWNFTYPDGDQSTELHLVVNQPTKFTLESQDVLHSFFVPAFRIKQDIVPGRYTHIWVLPTKTGKFRVYCAEYCGDSHSLMKTNVTVHATEAERKAATEWIESEKTPEENGARLYRMYCSGCHSVEGENMTGPPLNGIYGRQEPMASGISVPVDENYIRESILAPNAKIVAGYQAPSQMPSFEGKLSSDQMMYLIKFIQSLKDQ